MGKVIEGKFKKFKKKDLIDNIVEIYSQEVNFIKVEYKNEIYILEIIKTQDEDIDIWLSNEQYRVKQLIHSISREYEDNLSLIIFDDLEDKIKDYRNEVEERN